MYLEWKYLTKKLFAMVSRLVNFAVLYPDNLCCALSIVAKWTHSDGNIVTHALFCAVWRLLCSCSLLCVFLFTVDMTQRAAGWLLMQIVHFIAQPTVVVGNVSQRICWI